MAWWSGNYGNELNIKMDDAESCSGPGDQDENVRALARVPYIRKQLRKLSPSKVADELREYGAWDAEALEDHDRNLIRLLWIACGDLAEGR